MDSDTYWPTKKHGCPASVPPSHPQCPSGHGAAGIDPMIPLPPLYRPGPRAIAVAHAFHRQYREFPGSGSVVDDQ